MANGQLSIAFSVCSSKILTVILIASQVYCSQNFEILLYKFLEDLTWLVNLDFS